MEILILLGVVTGFVSGFFGVGGGTILVPMLLLAGFEMKNAVAISIMQMVFSSTYGSFLNFKKNTAILKDGLIIGFGGFLGGSLSGIIVSVIDSIYLKYIFLLVIIFTLYRIIFSSADPVQQRASKNKLVLILIGAVIGMIAMSIGVGGSVMLTPILAGYMYYNLKDASSLGLFFVIFSSIAGFISHSLSGHMLYYEGAIIGLSSMVGVYYGIKVKNMINLKSYKHLTVGLYVIILLSIIYKL